MIKPGSEYIEQAFKGENLNGVEIAGSIFQDCTFEGCTFSESIFRSCRLINCVFRGCDLSLIQVPGSMISGTRFENTKVIGVNWTLANWQEKGIWDPIQFKKCALNHSTFLGVNLSGIKVRRSEAVNVDFREADLSRVDFAFTDLTDSLFISTNLAGADLRYAKNYQIDPTKNQIEGARFSMPEVLALLYSMEIEISEE
jgi:uncharacterized protein YjbI with pentapeptide repeats